MGRVFNLGILYIRQYNHTLILENFEIITLIYTMDKINFYLNS